MTTGNRDALTWRLMPLDYWYYYSDHITFLSSSMAKWAAEELEVTIPTVVRFSRTAALPFERVRDLSTAVAFDASAHPIRRLLDGGQGGEEVVLGGRRPWTAHWRDHLLVVFQRGVGDTLGQDAEHSSFTSGTRSLPDRTLERLTPRGLGRSALVSWLSWAASVLVMVLVFPVMIARMGAQSFGWWAALTAPTNMTALFGLGVEPAVVSVLGRSLGRARAGAEDAEVVDHLDQAGSCARAGIVLSLIAAGAAVAVGFAARRDNRQLAECSSLTGPGCALVVSRQLSVSWRHAPGRRRLGGARRRGTCRPGRSRKRLCDGDECRVPADRCPDSADFRSLAWVSVATAATNVAAPTICLAGSGGTVLFRWGRLDLPAFRRLGGLAVSLGSVGAIGSTVDPAVKWTVGALGGGLPVAAYEVASRAILCSPAALGRLRLRSCPTTQGPSPSTAETTSRLRVTSASRLLVAVAFPTIALFAASSDALMRLWLGKSLPPGTVPSLEILAAGAIVAIGMRAAWAALIASGQGRRLLLVQVSSVSAPIVVLALAAEHLLPLERGGCYCLGVLHDTWRRADSGPIRPDVRQGRSLWPAEIGETWSGAGGHRHAHCACFPRSWGQPAQQVAVAAVVWLSVLVHLLRSERQLQYLVLECGADAR